MSRLHRMPKGMKHGSVRDQNSTKHVVLVHLDFQGIIDSLSPLFDALGECRPRSVPIKPSSLGLIRCSRHPFHLFHSINFGAVISTLHPVATLHLPKLILVPHPPPSQPHPESLLHLQLQLHLQPTMSIRHPALVRPISTFQTRFHAPPQRLIS